MDGPPGQQQSGARHDRRLVGRRQPGPIDALAVDLDVLAAAVLEDGARGPVGEEAVAELPGLTEPSLWADREALRDEAASSAAPQVPADAPVDGTEAPKARATATIALTLAPKGPKGQRSG
jgi:hypothetical protein